MENELTINQAEPTVVRREPFLVAGIRLDGAVTKGDGIPNLWNEFAPHIREYANRVGSDFFGVFQADKNGDMIYTAGVRVEHAKKLPRGAVAVDVDGGLFAKFTHCGDVHDIGQSFDYIFKTWMPNSGYAPDIRTGYELYDQRFKNRDEDSEFDIYVPVKTLH